jgi:hypothetical protein
VKQTHRLKKPLIIAAAALVLVAIAVVGTLTAVKTAPWELTYHLVPSDVTSALIWKGAYTSQLTEDEIIQVVHMLNQLEKKAFTVKYTHSGAKPAYGLTLHCGDLDVKLSQTTSSHGSLIMTFDELTSRSFASGQWIVDSGELTSYIPGLLDAKQAEAPQS